MNPLDRTLVTVAASALVLHVVFLALAAWRAWRGENSFDRLIGLDLIGILTLCVLVLFAILSEAWPALQANANNAILIDIALGLAALSYLSTIALAKYMVDHKMF
ncbi:MAG: monovalent cation/H+ antiporter complex subunit F [Anaerolineales bacterium]|jgi:multisubunit Na+/H+ antiporter MnhF subunit|nr:monovalent cation/H+ antiporter complex subunit F [Anaerolineales bacterium]